MNTLQRVAQTLDSRSKIIGAVASLLLLVFSRNGSIWLHLANTIPAVVLLAVIVRNPWQVIVRFKYLTAFLILAGVFHLGLFWYLPSLKNMGYRSFTYILSTSFCGISFGLFLSTTTSAPDFAQGLLRLKFPAKAVWMLTLAYRFLPLMQHEVRAAYSAAVLRGFRWQSRAGRDFAQLTAGLTQRAYDLAFQTGNAMYLRGFGLSSLPMKRRMLSRYDYLFLLGLPSSYMMIRWVTP